jgi:hypothetical protein
MEKDSSLQPIESKPLTAESGQAVETVVEAQSSRQAALAAMFVDAPELVSGQKVTWEGLAGLDGELIAPFGPEWRQTAHQIYIESHSPTDLRQKDQAWQRWVYDQYVAKAERVVAAKVSKLKAESRRQYLDTPSEYNFVWLRRVALQEVIGPDELVQWYETNRTTMPELLSSGYQQKMMKFDQAIVEQTGISPAEIAQKTDAIIRQQQREQGELPDSQSPTKPINVRHIQHQVLADVLGSQDLTSKYEEVADEYAVSYATTKRAMKLFDYAEGVHAKLGIWPMEIEQAVAEKFSQALDRQLQKDGRMRAADIALVHDKPLHQLSQSWYDLANSFQLRLNELTPGDQQEATLARLVIASKNALSSQRSLMRLYRRMAEAKYNQANDLPIQLGELNNYNRVNGRSGFTDDEADIVKQYPDRWALIKDCQAKIKSELVALAMPFSQAIQDAKGEERTAKKRIASSQSSMDLREKNIARLEDEIGQLRLALGDKALAGETNLMNIKYRAELRSYLQKTYHNQIEKLRVDVVKQSNSELFRGLNDAEIDKAARGEVPEARLSSNKFKTKLASARNDALKEASRTLWADLSPADRQRALTTVINQKIPESRGKIRKYQGDMTSYQEKLTVQTKRLEEARESLATIDLGKVDFENTSAKGLLEQFQQVAPEYMEQLVIYEHEQQAQVAKFDVDLAAIDDKYSGLAERANQQVKQKAAKLVVGVKRELIELITEKPVAQEDRHRLGKLWLAPSGLVVVANKQLLGMPVDVTGLSSKLEVMADDKLAQQIWQEYWSQSFGYDVAPLTARMNHTIDSVPHNPREQMVDHALQDFGLRCQPKSLIQGRDGRLTLSELTLDDLNSASQTIKALRGFINMVDKSPNLIDWDKQQQNLIKQLTFADGAAPVTSAVKIDDQQITLNLYQSQPQQSEAAFDVAVNQLGMGLYGRLSSEQQRQFPDTFSVPRGISQADYYRVTKVWLADSRRRNTATQRIAFVYQFRQYLAGRLPDEQKAFFDEIKAAYQQEQ